LDLGLAHVDTAELYGSGVVEEMVGEAISGRREEVFLVSKVMPSNASFSGTLRACEASLERLGTDWLDCYLLHWRGAYPLEETFAAFARLVEAGKIRSWGVSNFDVDDLEEALAVAGEGAVTCDQVLYNIEERTSEYRVLPWCEDHRISLVAYSPLGHGHFPSPSSRRGRVLYEVARDHGATPRQVALAFVIRRPSLFAIPKASRVEHVEENAGAADLRLSEEAIALLEEAFASAPSPELPML
jgi:diketogulonate reductase-like aldo/keto reductase